MNNFAAPGVLACDKLVAVEVLTPGGNWSSYPPHKHDTANPGEAVLEEIYYFEVADQGLGYQRVYSSERGADRHPGRGRLRRRGAGAVRLPRPVHGRARLRPLLPERAGRSRR
ncbi:5-deoxy-glucuronate isomerase [Nonomuraea ferruginea]